MAFVGRPGAGKSTSTKAIIDTWPGAARVSLAAPLYAVQRAFYERLGAPLRDGQQDGQLLNFLGQHFRSVRPDSLINDFEERVAFAQDRGADMIVCDDARPVDVADLRRLGFSIVLIQAPEHLRLVRKAGRGDVRAGDDDHMTEAGTITPDEVIANDADISSLAERVREVVERLPDVGPRHNHHRTASMLFDRASRFLASRYAASRHQIATTVLTAEGELFDGLHVETIIGRASVCAEAAALSGVLAARRGPVQMIMTVRHPRPEERGATRVVPPCGICRELIADWAPDALVAVSGDSTTSFRFSTSRELLPWKYRGTKWGTGSMGAGPS
ncbi:hypothetical protein [Clavibacter sp. VKM Ac-2872]|uniref:hypothetical protein n=1 Tax=Clavibacter sp. VKM Ac-2872 TaxID=2783812 RepID=UPI00188C0969|nr:hypothetical protein [Clavibacter sp. VKM Ac-2872]MBF4625457.1 hypothetical protein [Clavibacter sp. VKM Ac-2872]